MGKVKNLWMGESLTVTEKKELTKLSLVEFEKFPKNRKTPHELVQDIHSWTRRKFDRYECT